MRTITPENDGTVIKNGSDLDIVEHPKDLGTLGTPSSRSIRSALDSVWFDDELVNPSDAYYFYLPQRSQVDIDLDGLSGHAALNLYRGSYIPPSGDHPSPSSPILTSNRPNNAAEHLSTILDPGVYSVLVYAPIPVEVYLGGPPYPPILEESSTDYNLKIESNTVVQIPPEITTVNISATDTIADESGSNPGMFTITRTGDKTLPLTVNLAVSGSAKSGVDYIPISTLVTIPAGKVSTTIPVIPISDTVAESDETVVLKLALSNAYDVGNAKQATITIKDSTPLPGLNITGTDGDEILIGTERNDSIFGAKGNDLIFGLAGKDLIHGNLGNDFINGNAGNDTVCGGRGSDIVHGGKDDDLLYGDLGNDFVSGDQGNDTLTGVSIFSNNPGVGEVDTLIGGSGSDLFVLGDGARAYYNDGNIATPGIGDYALIREFVVTEDTLQLKAGLNYLIGSSPAGLPTGASILIDNDGLPGLTTNDELIGILQNLPLADAGLITSRFSFV